MCTRISLGVPSRQPSARQRPLNWQATSLCKQVVGAAEWSGAEEASLSGKRAWVGTGNHGDLGQERHE